MFRSSPELLVRTRKDYALEAEEHPGAEVIAVWDDRERGQVEASKRGVPFHDDLEGLLSREDVDGWSSQRRQSPTARSSSWPREPASTSSPRR